MTSSRKLLAFGLIGLLTFAIGTVGIQEAKPEYSIWSAMFAAIQLFRLESVPIDGPVPWALELARWVAMVLALTALLTVAARVAADTLVQVRLIIEQLVPGRFGFRERCVVVGLGRKGLSLVEDIQSRKHRRYRILGIDQDPDRIESARRLGIDVLLADATELGTLQRLTWRRTAWVVLLMGNDDANLTTALSIAQLRRNEETKVAVHVGDLKLRGLLDRQDVLKTRGFRLFNYYERAARRALLAYPVEALDLRDTPNHTNLLLGRQKVSIARAQVPHVYVRSSGHFVTALVASLARSGHIPHLPPRPWTRIKVTLVGSESEAQRARVEELYPVLRRAGSQALIDLDVIQPMQGASATQVLAAAILAQPTGTPTTVFLDVNDSRMALIEALALLDGIGIAVSDEPMRPGIDLRCIFDFADVPAVADFIKAHPGLRRHLFPLPSLVECCGDRALFEADDRIDDLARVIHAHYDRAEAMPWDSLTLELQDSNRAAADHVGVVLRALGDVNRDPTTPDFQWEADEIEALAECEHRRWSAQKLMAGWQPDHSLGESQNAQSRRHGCLDRSYRQLSEAMKERDRDNVRLIPVLLRRIAARAYD